MTSNKKLIPKAKNPRIVVSNSSKLLGTSRDTIRSVTAKANTPSLKVSIRWTSQLRLLSLSNLPERVADNSFLIINKGFHNLNIIPAEALGPNVPFPLHHDTFG